MPGHFLEVNEILDCRQFTLEVSLDLHIMIEAIFEI